MFFHAEMDVGPVAFQPVVECLDVAVARGQVHREGGPLFRAKPGEQLHRGVTLVNAREVKRRAVGAKRAQVLAKIVQQLEHGVAAVDRRHVNSRPAVRRGRVGLAAAGHERLDGVEAAVVAGEVKRVHFFLLRLRVEVRAEGQQRLDVGRFVFDRGDVKRCLAKRVGRIDRLAKLQCLPQRVGVIARGQLVQRAGLDLRCRLRLGRRLGRRCRFARPAPGLAKRHGEQRRKKHSEHRFTGLGRVHSSRSVDGGFKPQDAFEATKKHTVKKFMGHGFHGFSQFKFQS